MSQQSAPQMLQQKKRLPARVRTCSSESLLTGGVNFGKLAQSVFSSKERKLLLLLAFFSIYKSHSLGATLSDFDELARKRAVLIGVFRPR